MTTEIETTNPTGIGAGATALITLVVTMIVCVWCFQALFID